MPVTNFHHIAKTSAAEALDGEALLPHGRDAQNLFAEDRPTHTPVKDGDFSTGQMGSFERP
jgi:hypothetical protein